MLLDTHAFLWADMNDPRLSLRAREIIRSSQNDVLLSAISALEISIKASRGRLDLPEEAATFMPTRIAAFALDELPVRVEHAIRVADLPHHHSDPFDRLLIAQAQAEGVPILSSDPNIARYEVDVIW